VLLVTLIFVGIKMEVEHLNKFLGTQSRLPSLVSAKVMVRCRVALSVENIGFAIIFFHRIHYFAQQIVLNFQSYWKDFLDDNDIVIP
jgi:hypothetical protein